MEKDINKIVIGEDTYNFRDNSIPAWAKEPNKPSYNASDVGALPIGTNIPVIQYIANESLMPETPTEGVLYLTGDEPLISFTIDNTSYTAIEGMTWGEWCESEYNTNGFYIIGDYIYYYDGLHRVSRGGAESVAVNEYIESGYNYTLLHVGGSSD